MSDPSPLAGGFLSGKYSKHQPVPAGTRLEKYKDRFAGFDNERGWRTLEAVRSLAKAKETSVSAVALAWLIAKPTVTSVIFGARSLEQLDENLAAAEVKLSDEDIKQLDTASAFELGYPYQFIAEALARSVAALSGREVTALSGPREQVEQVCAALGRSDVSAGGEELYSLQLDGLFEPALPLVLPGQ